MILGRLEAEQMCNKTSSASSSITIQEIDVGIELAENRGHSDDDAEVGEENELGRGGNDSGGKDYQLSYSVLTKLKKMALANNTSVKSKSISVDGNLIAVRIGSVLRMQTIAYDTNSNDANNDEFRSRGCDESRSIILNENRNVTIEVPTHSGFSVEVEPYNDSCDILINKSNISDIAAENRNISSNFSCLNFNFSLILKNIPRNSKLSVRYSIDGDRFTPPWRARPIKLSTFLRGQKVPVHIRDSLPVVDINGKVIKI